MKAGAARERRDELRFQRLEEHASRLRRIAERVAAALPEWDVRFLQEIATDYEARARHVLKP